MASGLGRVWKYDQMSQAFTAVKRPASSGRPEYIEVEPNVRLHITDQGDGPVIILLPAWALSDEMYEYQYRFLVANGYRAIGLTPRGFGWSDKPFGRYDYDVFADDLRVVLETLQIEDAVLGGASMSGAVAIRYMARHQGAHIHKLALFGAAAPVHTRRNDFPYGIDKSQVDDMIRYLVTNRPALLENVGKYMAAAGTTLPSGIENWMLHINAQASPYAAEQGLIALRDSDLRADLTHIQIPTAIFHGRKDQIVGFEVAEQLHKGITGSVLVSFENSGHALFYEEMHKFNDELLKFIKQ